MEEADIEKEEATLKNELNVCYIISVVVVFNGVISVVGILAGPSSFNSHMYTVVSLNQENIACFYYSQ